MKIVYAGNGIRGYTCLGDLLKKGEDVVGVFLHEERDRRMEQLTKDFRVPIYSGDLNSDGLTRRLVELNPDLIILSGYNYILKKPLLDRFPDKIINLHGGKVPEYRGASVLNWAIINGETEGACNVLYVNEGIDTGNVITSETFKIGHRETINDIVKKTLDIFPKILEEAIIKFEKGFEGTSQIGKGHSYPKRKESDNEIDLEKMSGRQIYNLVRSQTKPSGRGAFIVHKEKKIKIWNVSEERVKGCKVEMPGFPDIIVCGNEKDLYGDIIYCDECKLW